MTTPKILVSCLETCLLLLGLAMLHRLLTFGALAGPLPLLSLDGGKAWLIGTCSDIWVAALGGMLVLVVATLTTLLGIGLLGRLFQLTLLLCFTGAAATHVAYAEFFHFQIIPFHLRYMTEPEFVSANSGSLFTWSVALSLVALPLLWFMVLRIDLFSTWSNGRQCAAIGALVVAALALHNRNIHYREQWFIPDNLQVNTLERLYSHLRTSRLPPPLNEQEIAELARQVEQPEAASERPLATQLWHLISRSAGAEAGPDLLANYRQVYAQDLAAKEKPLVLIVLLESMRPSETGYFAPAAGTSLTPTLDRLAQTGVVFRHAYSTGSVTRGAQEAAFCGYLGSRSTSLMRGEASARLSCLPDLIGQGGPEAARGVPFWLHGGDARFDGQVEFWHGHGVQEVMSLKDFPEGAARNGWGIGDRTFFHAAAARIVALRQHTSADYLFGMALSVTNHIPWDLPADAGDEVKLAPKDSHPSYQTTAYADAALGGLISDLEAAGVWAHTLLIISSDHGTTLPPFRELYAQDKNREHLLASHINLIFAGGLTTRALALQGGSSQQVDQAVSQAGIAPFVADVLQLKHGRFMAEDPLEPEHHLPVLSDLEQDLFDHGSSRAFTRHDLTSPVTASLTPEEHKALLYYRAFLQYIYLPP